MTGCNARQTVSHWSLIAAVASTSTAGKWLAKTGPKNPYKEAPLGTLIEGSYADVILVDGNPLESTDVLADYENSIDIVMVDGVVHVDNR